MHEFGNNNDINMILRQNHILKQHLRQANFTIANLQKQIQILKMRLSKYQNPSNQYSYPKTPKMKIQQHFEASSEDETPQHKQKQSSSIIKRNPIRPLPSYGNVSSPLSSNKKQINKKVTINHIDNMIQQDELINRKKEIKVLKKSSEKKKQPCNENNIKNHSFKSLSTKQIPTLLFDPQQFSQRSQKVLFKKTTNSKSIFEFFFVTGINKQGPFITYSYPINMTHNFQGYLHLLYGQNSLRQPDLSPNNSKNKLNTTVVTKENSSINIRDTFVIPIIKCEAKNSQKNYLIICQVEEGHLQKQFAGCYFPRYFCFISQWKFFYQFKNLMVQFIDRIYMNKNSYGQLNEIIYSKIIQQQTEDGLRFLNQKYIDYNNSLDCCIGNSGLKFSVDIPASDLSYQMIQKYQQWKIIYSTVQFRYDDDIHSPQTLLLGVLVAYALAQIKIVLYSTTKSKISQCILQLLEIIKPFTYVNPIILTILKQEHENFLDAPMSIILGLWGQQRKTGRQKIQIFMNKKLNLMGLIQKGKLQVKDGIIINLDTGLIFGGGINKKLNEIAFRFNEYRLRFSKPRQSSKVYKIIERMVDNKFDSQQARQIWNMLMPFLQNTQTFCYHKQNKED